MGIPVVATDSAEIRRFNEEHGDVIAIAPDAEDFAAAIEAALKSPTDGVGRAPHRGRAPQQLDRRAMGTMADARRAGPRRRSDAARRSLGRAFRRALPRAPRRRTIQAVAVVVAAFTCCSSSRRSSGGSPRRCVWTRRRSRPTPSSSLPAALANPDRPGGGYQERVVAGGRSVPRRLRAAIVFSSGFRFALREAEVMRDLAVANGVPPDAIVLEDARGEHARERAVHRRHPAGAWVAEHSAGQLAVSHAARAADLARQRRRSDGRADAACRRASSTSHERGATLEQIRRHSAGIPRDRGVLAPGLDLRSTLRKLAIITIPADGDRGACSMGGIEVWVRASVGSAARHARILSRRSRAGPASRAQLHRLVCRRAGAHQQPRAPRRSGVHAGEEAGHVPDPRPG